VPHLLRQSGLSLQPLPPGEPQAHFNQHHVRTRDVTRLSSAYRLASHFLAQAFSDAEIGTATETHWSQPRPSR
ncbi:unnamed protein product, partial [Rangifer tarandus platyrhynchus]